MLALVGTPGLEEALCAEFPADHREHTSPWPGVVTCEPDAGAPPIDPVFARQQLPSAALVRGGSVTQLCRAAFDAVDAAADAHRGPLTLHATTPFRDSYTALTSRADLVGKELLELFREKRRRSWRRFRPPSDTGATARDCLVVQVLLVERGAALVSASVPVPLPLGGTDVSPWPAGIAPVHDDRRPPSRAYRKLEEAFRWMGAAPCAGETCVDLGASPGGWSWTALARGARVIAVDRAPLLPPAAGHPLLEMKSGSAFTFEPTGPVDWLLCDVICEPPRTVALLETWLARGGCRSVVASIKFKGRAGYGILADLHPMLARAGWRFARVKQLFHNRNEVTVMMRR